MDAAGRDITPRSNKVTFTLRDNSNACELETILTKEEAQQYTLERVFGDWQPAEQLKRIEKTAAKLKKQHQQN
jgi:exonuclease VII small subunit